MSVLHTITQSFFLRQRIGIVRSYNTLIFQISFQKFKLSTVNMMIMGLQLYLLSVEEAHNDDVDELTSAYKKTWED